MRARLLLALVGMAASTHALPASSAPLQCHVVTDPAGDAVRQIGPSPLSTQNDPALDVLSADVGIGATTLAFVVRVADLTDDPSPQSEGWMMWFEVQGQGFATHATRTVDGVDFRVLGDFPEHQEPVPGATTAELPVTGSLDTARNEIRVDVPRGLLPVLRPSKDELTNLTVDSLTGVGISTVQVGAATTVDRTVQPGPRLALNARTCIRAS